MEGTSKVRQHTLPLDIHYWNINNNARHKRTSTQNRDQQDQNLPYSLDQHHNTQLEDRSDNLHIDDVHCGHSLDKPENDFDGINYVLMRENIEKRKRIKILKQVKSVFDIMFTRVQDITDDLKVQLNEAMKQHLKANKIVNKLHTHIAGLQGALDFQGRTETFASERDGKQVVVTRRRSPNRLILPAIESANSSRPCSLPDVFKVESSDNSPTVEELHESRTRNIRKIAAKKSHAQSLIETSITHRQQKMRDVPRKKCLPRENDIVKTVNSKSSIRSAKERFDSKSKRVRDPLEKLSGSGTRSNQHIQARGHMPSEAASNKTQQKEAYQENCSATVGIYRNELGNRCSKKSVRQRNEQMSLKNESTTSFGNETELFNQKRCTKPNTNQHLKLKNEEIVEKIKSIERNIIQPNKTQKESIKNLNNGMLVQKREGKREFKKE